MAPRTISLRSGAKFRFSASVLDAYFAPHLSQLTSPQPPEVEEMPNYFGSLILNQVFAARIFDEHQAPLLASFVRHLRTATDEYRSGRESLLRYVDRLSDATETSHHRLAITSFESCILRAHLAIVCLSRLGEILGQKPVYERDDGSDYDRLRLLNNRIKHFEDDIAKAAKKKIPVPIAPVWLTNEGIQSSRAALSYYELAEILTVQAVDAKDLTETLFDEWRLRARKIKAKGLGDT